MVGQRNRLLELTHTYLQSTAIRWAD